MVAGLSRQLLYHPADALGEPYRYISFEICALGYLYVVPVQSTLIPGVHRRTQRTVHSTVVPPEAPAHSIHYC
jgi:hypothetical protein